MNMINRIMRVFLIAFILPLIIMMVLLGDYEYTGAKNAYYERVSSVLRNISAETKIYVRDLKAQTSVNSDSQNFRNLFANPSDPQLISMAKNDLTTIARYSQNSKNTAVISTDGKILASYQPMPSSFPLGYFKLDNDSEKKDTFIDFTFLGDGAEVYFCIYSPIMLNDIVQGYYVQLENTDYLETLLSATLISENETFNIIDNSNNVVSATQFYDMDEEAFSLDNDSFENKFRTNEAWIPGEIRQTSYKTKDGLIMNAVFMRDSTTGLCYVFSNPKSESMSGVYKILSKIFMCIFLFLIILVCICIHLQRTLKQSFNEIFKTIEIYEMGDWTYRPNIDAEDEMGSIAASLWKLAQNLNKMYMDIRFNEYRYKLAMEFSGDIIYDLDLIKNIFDADRKKWDNMFPFTYMKNEKKISEEMIKIIHDDDKEKFEEYRNQLFRDCYDEIEKQSSIEFRIKLKDDNYHWIERKDVLVKGVSDNIEHIIGTLIVIDERKNSELALTQKATIDSLTSLYNRFTFINKVGEFLNMGNLTDAAIIFVDLDDFKFINDTYGHDAGDDVLRYVGKVIRDATENIGLGGRYGGDEFLIFLNSKNSAVPTADYILKMLAKDFAVRGTGIKIKLRSSIGISYFPEHDNIVDGLIKKADDAMYYSKKHGKNRYTIFDMNKGDYKDEQ